MVKMISTFKYSKVSKKMKNGFDSKNTTKNRRSYLRDSSSGARTETMKMAVMMKIKKVEMKEMAEMIKKTKKSEM